MKNLLMFTSMFLTLFIVSCSSGSDDDDDPIINPPATTITYTNTISAIVNGNCTGCHGSTPTNGAPMSLTTYNNVKDAVVNRGLINQIETGNMPKNGTDLTATQIQNFKTWQTNGFPQ
jgi:mono/diheme cytochrome c family protein